MSTTKDVTFWSDRVTITKVAEHVKVRSYPYSKITAASKSRLENLQFKAAEKPMVLFTLDNKEMFATFRLRTGTDEH